MSSTDAVLARAYGQLRERRLDAAEATCREVLGLEPRNAAALHLLGLIRKEAGDAVAGEQLLRTSIALAPHRAEFQANLGNLLRRLRRLGEAEQSYRAALAQDARHPTARLGLARTLIDLGRNADAEAECRALLEASPHDAQAWSALASSLQAQDRLAEAESAYRNAIAARPDYAIARHNLGAILSQLDRAEEALAELERAQAAGLRGPELALNRGRTLFKLYRLDDAERAYEEAISLAPHYADAHLSLAELRYMRGDPQFARSLSDAAARAPEQTALRMKLADLQRRAGDLAGAEASLRQLIASHGPIPEVRSSLSAVLHEAGRLAEAETEALEAAAARPLGTNIIENLVAVQLARGRADEALAFIRNQRALHPREQRWIAYEATAARMSGDPLYRELYDYDALVRQYSIEPQGTWPSIESLNAALENALASRHRFVTHPLNQSLRNGSQTARSLLVETDPAVAALLRSFHVPIDEYRRILAARPAARPAAGASGFRLRGCWSVQLRRGGFHVNHIHPEGWISSVYYVGVPSEVSDTDERSGWLTFGEPPFSVPGAGPERFVQPRPGLLVLFPSYMWHGTTPLHGSEPRLTVAFDAVPA